MSFQVMAQREIQDKLLTGISLDSTELAVALSRNLTERIDDTIGGLSYVGETEDEQKIDHNLQFTQFWRTRGAEMAKSGIREPHLTEAFQLWQSAGGPVFTLTKLKRWRRMAEAIARQSNSARALDHWWAIDRRFTPLEDDVSEAVFKYDEDINMRT